MIRRNTEEEMPKDMAVERHYTESEIAEMWHLHRKTVHRIFTGQPGIVEFGEETRRSRRIPESVMLRVHRDLRRKS